MQSDKVGIVGVNGAGKTTLFPTSFGRRNSGRGNCFCGKKGFEVSYMKQHTDAVTDDRTAFEEVLDAFADVIAAEEKLEKINAELTNSSDPTLIKRQAQLTEFFAYRGGATYRSRARSALLGLGIPEEEHNLSMSALSGGHRTRGLAGKTAAQRQPTAHA